MRAHGKARVFNAEAAVPSDIAADGVHFGFGIRAYPLAIAVDPVAPAVDQLTPASGSNDRCSQRGLPEKPHEKNTQNPAYF